MSNIKTGDILNFNYTGAVQSITLPKGTYTLECWGAQGGNRSQDSASATVTGSGLGGYSIGTLTLTQSTTCYIYVGGKGGMSSSTGNVKVKGGFNGGGFASHESTGEPGNGGGGATDVRIAQDSLYARVIVAGGGGGSGEDNETGGYGGGETGGAGSGNTSLTQASQTSGGTNSFGFGLGGNTYNGGAGGGGWYGGSSRYSVSSYSTGSDSEGGGGGSGYVYTSSTAENYPSGCLLNSSYYLSNARTIAGNTSFTSPTGSSETGHSGNGYCRITVIECNSTALYGKLNGSMKKATGFYFKLNNKMYGVGHSHSNNSIAMNFSYTGSVQTATLTPGTYKLECWGAQGGNSTYHNTTGGKGGYSSGLYTISKTTSVFIYVGGMGNTGSYAVNGGWNGGGGVTNSYNNGGDGNHLGTGGGATDISLIGGECSLDQNYRYVRTENSYKSRIIVAGGGGGAEGQNGTAGGGATGINDSNQCAATQNAAGRIDYGSSSCSSWVTMFAGGLGYGVSTSGGHTNHAMGACGGGGWYGGGAYGYNGDQAHGYGGSGYVSSSLSSTVLIDGSQSFLSPTGTMETGHSGDGFCRITNLNPSEITYLDQKTDIMDFNYTGQYQSITLKPGQYTLECWGAQGGYRSNASCGGKGGYSIGTISLSQSTTLYINVGGSGNSVSSATNNIYPGGFNGGGYRYGYKGGGGATDVRIGNNSLYSRVIVAGGGGSDGAADKTGKHGGGTSGGSTTQNYGSGGYGGTQTGNTWKSDSQGTSNTSSSCYAGFGFGGFGYSTSSGYGGAGGGGWYGGSGSAPDGSGDDDRGGGGGSGYVYTSSTAKNYPQGCLLNSSYYLTDAQTIAGNQAFTSPEGTSETGHSGNGFCRITNMTPKQYGMFIKRNGTWTHIDL